MCFLVVLDILVGIPPQAHRAIKVNQRIHAGLYTCRYLSTSKDTAMQPCPGCPTLADHHGKLGSPSTKRARNPRRRERNDKSSGPLRRRGVVRRISIGCQMTSGYRTCSCMLKCTGHQTILHGELSVDAGHVDRGSHKKASVLLLLSPARAAQQDAKRSRGREGQR